MPRKPATPPPPQLGQVLTDEILGRGLSQNAVSKLCHVPQSTLNDILRGAKDPSLGTILKILGGLGLTLLWLHSKGIRPATTDGD
ncbi:MAG TPA: helix-turn-helix transcriptional regulator [Urbifossiella sp.]|jgi:plasmid maintenance system antidote protein VapI|nr:helix-turn-helix transcriptional regulator [Urbifossiella sp.]